MHLHIFCYLSYFNETQLQLFHLDRICTVLITRRLYQPFYCKRYLKILFQNIENGAPRSSMGQFESLELYRLSEQRSCPPRRLSSRKLSLRSEPTTSSQHY